MYVNPELASKTFPTIRTISSYLKKADSENPNERDIRPMMSLLLRCTTAIPRLRGHILTRKTAVTAYDYTIDPIDEAFAEPASRALARCRRAIDQVLASHTDTPLFGVYGSRIEFAEAGEAGQPARVSSRLRPFELLRVDADTIALLDEANNPLGEYGIGSLEALDAGLLLDADDSHERGGILRSIVFHAALSQRTVEEWNRLNSRLKGIVTGSVDAEKLNRSIAALNIPESEIESMMTAISEALKNAGDDNYLRTLSAVEVTVSRVAEAAAGGSYKSFIDYLDSSIAVAVLGQANTSQLPAGGGSRAALQVLQLIQADINFDDLNRCERMIDRLLLMDYRQNKDRSATSVPYRFRFVFDDAPDSERAARTFEALSRIPADIPVRRSEVYDRLGLSVPADDDEVISFANQNGGLL